MNKQELKLGSRILENLPIMSSDVMQGWIDNPKALQKFLAALVPEETSKPYLRHIKTGTLAPTKGSVTLAAATDVSTDCIDVGFQDWNTDVEGKDTTATEVDVYEIVRDGYYEALFGSLGDPSKLCLTQGQIVEFCRSHRDSLRQEGYATFFLFEVNGELFVANVYVAGGQILADVSQFDDGFFWFAGNRHRLVVQQ